MNDDTILIFGCHFSWVKLLMIFFFNLMLICFSLFCSGSMIGRDKPLYLTWRKTRRTEREKMKQHQGVPPAPLHPSQKSSVSLTVILHSFLEGCVCVRVLKTTSDPFIFAKHLKMYRPLRQRPQRALTPSLNKLKRKQQKKMYITKTKRKKNKANYH